MGTIAEANREANERTARWAAAALEHWRRRHPGEPDPEHLLAALDEGEVVPAPPDPEHVPPPGVARMPKRSASKARRPRAFRRAVRRLEAATPISDTKRARQFEQWAAEHGGEPLPLVPRWLWVLCVQIMADASGAIAREQCARLPTLFAGMVRSVARVRRRHGGYLYQWGELRARRTVALAVCIYRMSKRVRGRGRWARLTEGIPVGFFCKLLRDPHTGRIPHANTVASGSYGWGGKWNAQPSDRGRRDGVGCGIVEALRQVGALYRCQWRGKHYGTTTGYPPNQYWLVSEHPEDDPREDEQERLYAFVEFEQLAELQDEHAPPCPTVLQGTLQLDRGPPAAVHS